MTYTMQVLSPSDHDRVLATLTCEQEHDHGIHITGCTWYGQWLTYQSAAIGEGHCPSGCGRLDPDWPRPSGDDGRGVGGWCHACGWWWSTGDGVGGGITVSMSRPDLQPRPLW